MDAQDAQGRGYTMHQQGAKTRADNLYANGGALSYDKIWGQGYGVKSLVL